MGHLGGLAWHSWIDLVNFAPIQPFPQTTFGTSTTFAWPSFVYLASGTILGITTDMVVYGSTDDGVTFDSLFTIGDGDSNVDISASTVTPTENPLRKSNDDMVIATLGGFENAGITGNPDIIYWYGSADGGATWSGIIAGVGNGTSGTQEYGQVANRDYAPYFTNFSQVNLTVDPTGVSHVLANGYGEGPYGWCGYCKCLPNALLE